MQVPSHRLHATHVTPITGGNRLEAALLLMATLQAPKGQVNMAISKTFFMEETLGFMILP